MTWFDLTWAALALLALTAILGGGVAWAVGLRGYWIPAAAPAFLLTIVSGTAVAAPWVGIGWSIVPVVVVTVLIAAPAYLLRRRGRRRGLEEDSASRARRVDPWLIVAVLLASAALTVTFLRVVGAPDQISQTFDNVFHLNGVRFVLDTGNASSLHLGYMTSPSGGLAFYPAAWHGVAALLVQLTGVSIPVATNALALVASAVYWPVTVLLLTRSLFGRSAVLTVATGAIAASVPAFPVLLYDYGVLYPLLLGLSVLPFALAVCARVLRLSARVAPQGAGWWSFIGLGAIVGMTLAHPGAFVALLALSAPMVVIATIIAFRATRSVVRRTLLLGAFGLYLIAGVILVDVLRPPVDARGWPLSLSMGDAALTILTVSPWYQVPAIVVAVGVVLGLVWTCIDRSAVAFAAGGMYLVAAWLLFTVAALPFPQIRDAFTGSWYNNFPRLAAIFAIALVPLSAYGILRSIRWAGERRVVKSLPTAARRGVGIAAAVVLFAGMQAGAPQRATEWASAAYRDTTPAPLLDEDERTLLERLDEAVPAGEVVAGNPFTGAALAYAFADRRVLQPHTLVEMSAAKDLIVDALTSGEIDPGACRAMDEEGVRFVLDFGADGVHGPVTGYAGLTGSPDVTLVDSEGAARLYEVTSCARG